MQRLLRRLLPALRPALRPRALLAPPRPMALRPAAAAAGGGGGPPGGSPPREHGEEAAGGRRGGREAARLGWARLPGAVPVTGAGRSRGAPGLIPPGSGVRVGSNETCLGAPRWACFPVRARGVFLIAVLYFLMEQMAREDQEPLKDIYRIVQVPARL